MDVQRNPLLSNSSFRTSYLSSQGEQVLKSSQLLNRELSDRRNQTQQSYQFQSKTKMQYEQSKKPSPLIQSQKLEQINNRMNYLKTPQIIMNAQQLQDQYEFQNNKYIKIEIPESHYNGRSSYDSVIIKEPVELIKNEKPFSKLRTEYNDFRTKKDYQTQLTTYSEDRKPQPQLFSYFYHDMEKEEKEYVVPKKLEQRVCKYHSEPVIMYSLPYASFICQMCYDTYGDKSSCFALSDLQKPMEIQYATLMKFIDEGREPKVQKQLMEHKVYLEQVKEDRYKYLTEFERALIDKQIQEILFDLQKFWRKIQEMQIQYRQLKQINDFETILLMYQRWSSICYDFKDKYLSFDYLKNLVDRKIDPIMRPIALKVGVCYMCMKNPAVLSCNNVQDQQCRICKECSSFCTNHGYYCRMHAQYYGQIAEDKHYNGNSCQMCKYENIQLQ